MGGNHAATRLFLRVSFRFTQRRSYVAMNASWVNGQESRGPRTLFEGLPALHIEASLYFRACGGVSGRRDPVDSLFKGVSGVSDSDTFMLQPGGGG